MVIGLLLAAGGGRRFGGPKAPYVHQGERLVDRGVRLLREAGCQEVVVVLGAWVGEVADATVVINSEWESGQASSLLKGLDSLPVGAERVCVLLVDQIGMTSRDGRCRFRRSLLASHCLHASTFHSVDE